MDPTIWKFELESAGVTEIEMPAGARVLGVQNQQGIVVLWALVDPLATPQKRTFLVALTGGRFPAKTDAAYIGTVQLARGTFVAHIFEVA